MPGTFYVRAADWAGNEDTNTATAWIANPCEGAPTEDGGYIPPPAAEPPVDSGAEAAPEAPSIGNDGSPELPTDAGTEPGSPSDLQARVPTGNAGTPPDSAPDLHSPKDAAAVVAPTSPRRASGGGCEVAAPAGAAQEGAGPLPLLLLLMIGLARRRATIR